MQQDQITVTGHVGTAPKHLTTPSGLAITSFRLGSTGRRFDREKDAWVDTDTNWYSVNTYRQLAKNTAASLELGQSVVVVGRLRVRAWEKDDRHGTTVEIDADAVGHDLSWGTSTYTRVKGGSAVATEEDTFAEVEARALAESAESDEAAGLPVPF